MRLATRLFAIISLIVAGTVITVIMLADTILRGHFEHEIASGLERNALANFSSDARSACSAAMRCEMSTNTAT